APPSFERAVRSCLAKDPEDRWQSAHDVASELRWISDSLSHPSGSVAIQPKKKSFWLYVCLAILALAITLLTANSFLRLRPTGAPPVVRFTVNPPDETSFVGGIEFSPDGRTLVFTAAGKDGFSNLWIRSLDSTESKKIAGSEGASFPFWSPDSRAIGFFA